MAVVTAAVVEARAPGAVEVSTAEPPLLAATTVVAVTVAAIVAAFPDSAVGDRPRDLALAPMPQEVQVPHILGLGKVTVPATHPPDGISFRPATPGREVAKQRAVPRPGPAIPPWQQGLSPCRITPL